MNRPPDPGIQKSSQHDQDICLPTESGQLQDITRLAPQYRQDVTSAPGGAVLIARSTNFGMNIWW